MKIQYFLYDIEPNYRYYRHSFLLSTVLKVLSECINLGLLLARLVTVVTILENHSLLNNQYELINYKTLDELNLITQWIKQYIEY